MYLTAAAVSVLEQMEFVIGQLSDDDFVKPSVSLSNVTIGQHLRHTIEFFLCLESGFDSGNVNYDNRNHDKMIETDRMLALAALERIKQFLNFCQEDKPLRLEVGYERHSDSSMIITTNFSRELIYNIEHAVHHMALMKIGVREVSPYVQIPEDFGIAVSTLRYNDLTRV